MKRLLFLAFLLYSIQYAYAQTVTGRMEIFHSKEVTDSLLQDYVGIWKYEDTLNRLVFQVELITMDNSRTIALRGRYSLNKDGEYITNEFNDPYIIRSKESSISGLLFKRYDFIVLSFTDRGNKNREAGTTEWGKEYSFLKTYQENGVSGICNGISYQTSLKHIILKQRRISLVTSGLYRRIAYLKK